MKALGASNNFKALTQRKFIVIAKVVEPPKLLVEGTMGDALAWKFQMPVLITYIMPPFSPQSKFVNPLIVTVVVRRQNILQSYKGLAVTQLIANLAMNNPGQNTQ
jgi:intracellular multiplication protein IcmL